MAIRPISKELQQVAISELNENPDTIQENLERLKEWLQKQPHLNARSDDQSLITFLRGCKWSLQRTKEKIDYFYTFRTQAPNFFTNRDPFDPLIQKMLEKGLAYTLPNTDRPAGAKIFYADFSMVDYEIVDPTTLFKLFFILADVLTFGDDNFLISGEKLIINYAGIPISFILQLTPEVIRSFTIGWMTAYPLRHKVLIGINTPIVVEKIFNNLILPFLSKKHQSRIYLFSSENMEKAYSFIPKTLFPEELGGNNGSRSKLAGELKTKVESYKQWLLEDYQYGTIESLRPGKLKGYNEEYCMEGTFRKLDID